MYRQMCRKCAKSTEHIEYKVSILTDMALSIWKAWYALAMMSLVIPILGWVMLPFVFIIGLFVAPFCLITAAIGLLLPKTHTAIECKECGKVV